MIALFDTNIIIDYLSGNEKAAKEFNLYTKRYISIITWIEVLVGIEKSSIEEALIINFLKSNFKIIEVNIAISNLSIDIRREYKIKNLSSQLS